MNLFHEFHKTNQRQCLFNKNGKSLNTVKESMIEHDAPVCISSFCFSFFATWIPAMLDSSISPAPHQITKLSGSSYVFIHDASLIFSSIHTYYNILNQAPLNVVTRKRLLQH